MNCIYCKEKCIKKGFQTGKQKLFCKNCKRYQQSHYTYTLYNEQYENAIIRLNNEGMSIRGISRIIGISKTTVIRKIKSIANTICKPVFIEQQEEYEVDELRTFVKEKMKYEVYIYTQLTKKIKM